MNVPSEGEPQRAVESEGDRKARNIGIGCFTAFAGCWSGGIVAVLIGRIVEGLRQSPSCEGLPICNWASYAFVGAAAGAITLPVLVLMRLKRRDVRR
jgi:hypothetical protein